MWWSNGRIEQKHLPRQRHTKATAFVRFVLHINAQNLHSGQQNEIIAQRTFGTFGQSVH
jgi:hypothetical protein